MAAAALSFPTDVEEFNNDDRISFSRLSNTYIGVHDDGSEFEFHANLKRWIRVADDEHHEEDTEMQAGSSLHPDSDPHTRPNKRKTSPAQNDDEETATQAKKPRPSKKSKPPPAPRQNTAVYVTGLPVDATVDEVNELFSKKGGVIAEEIDSGKPRIKMYTDEQGAFKGDALVVFFKPQSVEMAIMLLDDTDFRYTSSGLSSGKIRVQAADSSYKKTSYDQEPAGAGNGEKPKPKNSSDRQKIIKKTQKLDAKLADWDDDGPPPEETRTSKLVILKHMFTLREIEEDPAAILEIKEDIREECERLGEVTNVVLFDLEPEGIVSVKFKKSEAAEACVEKMDGRAFDGRKVEARLSFGREKFKQSGKKKDGESDEE
ncbi:related to cold sensitive U2 snRNA supressor [Cephalotrichum gorgonifer]|uniref:Related to cold sensitive U2 snRNA supressor n=1 Tax=Cephalotrichum gorgonifer TaxID=2041049 RepID=A0AAE8MQJ3_9PEZI|nr:related to cold sensitive U2 snRNA supressor [Cephalotrichum gorgonifer]